MVCLIKGRKQYWGTWLIHWNPTGGRRRSPITATGVIIYTAARVIEYSTCERRRKWGEFRLNCEEPSCKKRGRVGASCDTGKGPLRQNELPRPKPLDGWRGHPIDTVAHSAEAARRTEVFLKMSPQLRSCVITNWWIILILLKIHNYTQRPSRHSIKPRFWVCFTSTLRGGAVVRAVALQQEEGCGFEPRAPSVWTLHAYILSEWVLFTSTHNPKTWMSGELETLNCL